MGRFLLCIGALVLLGCGGGAGVDGGDHDSNVDETAPLDDPADLPLPRCGDGQLDEGEECDGGDVLPGDGCDDACQTEEPALLWTCNPDYYGDGEDCDCGCGIPDPDCDDATVESCEFCDNVGSCNATADCARSLILPTDNALCGTGECGNGIIEVPEACDDGGGAPGDGCDADCFLEPPSAWSCSPAYYDSNDGCDCGCGAVDPDCADANLTSCDFCTNVGSCNTINSCADSSIDPTDNAVCTWTAPPAWTCEPSFYDSGDGCDCGCGVVDPDCADATAASCEYCTGLGSCNPVADCSQSIIDPDNNALCSGGGTCGNSAIEIAETCDDGNTLPGDGCDASCQIEPPPSWSCGPYYARGDGCDCGCGALDPDCDDATRAACDFCDDEGSCNSAVECELSTIAPTTNWTCE